MFADISFYVAVDGIKRRLLKFVEEDAGDVYIRLFSGLNAEMSDQKIAEHRYSIHMSKQSLEYNVIKKTFKLQNGHKVDGCCLTNAVKSKNGFTPIFFIRFSSLQSKLYNVEVGDDSCQSLGKYDPDNKTLMLGLLVGHRDSIFPERLDGADITLLKISDFKFAIIRKYIEVPSLMTGNILTKVTHPPEIFEEPDSQELIRMHMNALSVEECLNIFNHATNVLLKQQLEIMRDFFDDLEVKANIQEEINSLELPAGMQF